MLGYDHNWNNAGTYPIQLMQAAPNTFDGVSFHCYSVRGSLASPVNWLMALQGSVTDQDTFHTAYPTKEVSRRGAVTK